MVQAFFCLARKQLPRKRPGVPGGQQANTFQQCALAAMKTNHILGCINKNVLSRLREVIVLVLRPHGEYNIRFWASQCKKDTDILEWVQRMATKIRLRKVGLSILKKRMLSRELTAICSYLVGRCREDGVRLLIELHGDRTSGSRCKLEHTKFWLDVHKKNPPNHEDGQTLEQVALRGCRNSILGDIQNPTAHSLSNLL